jgi:dienelactone hydrolase
VSEHGDHRIEHVTFESRPGFWVTANLYLPADTSTPVPGVLFPCGHSANGKAYPLYVEACVRLAREGCAALIYDPVNQGERDLYATLDTGGRLTRNNPCDGHNVIGRQLHARGDWLGAWRLWDGLRAVDYLVTRPEVDATRLAATGQSGGGTLSAYLWAMEPRFRAVASSCWCTSYLNDLENAMPADEEQYPPGFLAAGLDKIDFFTARAGEPALLLGQELDFFDDRGLRAGYAELLRLHRLLGGADELCRLELDTGTHAYSLCNQRAMLAFFNRVFGKPAPAPDRPVTPHAEAALLVTPGGSVDAAGSTPMREQVAAQAAATAAARRPVAAAALPAVIRKTLGIPPALAVPHHRRFFQTALTLPDGQQRQVYRFALEAEPGLCCVLRHVCRNGTPYRLAPGAAATLFLPNLDSQEEIACLDADGARDDFWVLDVRGLGEGLFRLGDPLALYGHDYMSTGHAILYGESLLGHRVRDVLAAVRLLCAEGAQAVHLVGRRQGAVLALLAGILDPAVASVSSREAPESFLALATAPFTFWPAVNFPHGVLRAFDLPEVRVALGPRLVEDTRASPVEFPAPPA